MILVLEDDGCVHVYATIDAVIRQVEGLDAEGTLRAVFDDRGQRFAIRWVSPNRESRAFLGISMVENGTYILEPVGTPDTGALIAIPPVFTEFLACLTARYPCICDLPDEKVDDGVWSDGPLRNNLGHRASVIGMVYSRVDEVLPFLIEQANSLGLVVFDWATEVIHRPLPRRER